MTYDLKRTTNINLRNTKHHSVPTHSRHGAISFLRYLCKGEALPNTFLASVLVVLLLIAVMVVVVVVATAAPPLPLLGHVAKIKL